MNIENLIKLRNHMLNVKPELFNMEACVGENECGTVACLAGHAFLAFASDEEKHVAEMPRGFKEPSASKYYWPDVSAWARDWLGLTVEQADRLFYGYWDGAHLEIGGVIVEQTPASAIRELDRLIDLADTKLDVKETHLAERAHELLSLQERIHAATGPDRELDIEIHRVCGMEINEEARRIDGVGKPGYGRWPDDGSGISQPRCYLEIPRVTASIEAALALVERMLPGWQDDNGRCGGVFSATLWDSDCDYCTPECFAATRPLAILNALLMALIAREKGN